MNVAEYTEAMKRLPPEYKVAEFTNTMICLFQGKIIVATAEHVPLCYFDDAWHELKPVVLQ